jgi:hypothetical protein
MNHLLLLFYTLLVIFTGYLFFTILEAKQRRKKQNDWESSIIDTGEKRVDKQVKV